MSGHLVLVVVDQEDGVAEEVPYVLEKIACRRPAADPAALLERVLAEEVLGQLGHERLSAAGQPDQPQGEPVLAPDEPLEHGQRDRGQEAVHDPIVEQPPVVVDEVALERLNLLRIERAQVEVPGAFFALEVDPDRVIGAGRMEPVCVDPPARDEVGIPFVRPAEVIGDRPRNRFADRRDRGTKHVSFAEDDRLRADRRVDRLGEPRVAREILGRDRELRRRPVQHGAAAEHAMPPDIVQDANVLDDLQEEVGQLDGIVPGVEIDPAALGFHTVGVQQVLRSGRLSALTLVVQIRKFGGDFQQPSLDLLPVDPGPFRDRLSEPLPAAGTADVDHVLVDGRSAQAGRQSGLCP